MRSDPLPVLTLHVPGGLVSLNKAAAVLLRAHDPHVRLRLVAEACAWYLFAALGGPGYRISYRFGGPVKFHAAPAVRALLTAGPLLAGGRCRLVETVAAHGRAFELWPLGAGAVENILGC